MPSADPARVARRIRRVVRLARILERERAPDYDTVARTIGISRRTLFRDLAILRDAGVDIEYSPNDRGYRADSQRIPVAKSLTLKEVAAFLLWTRRRDDPPSHSEYGQTFRTAVQKIAELIDAESKECIEMIEQIMDEFARSPRRDAARRRV